MSSYTITYYEYRIVDESGNVLWQGLAEGNIDAFGTWIEKNPHKVAIALAEGKKVSAVKL